VADPDQSHERQNHFFPGIFPLAAKGALRALLKVVSLASDTIVRALNTTDRGSSPSTLAVLELVRLTSAASYSAFCWLQSTVDARNQPFSLPTGIILDDVRYQRTCLES
jgi:hypothetical protein